MKRALYIFLAALIVAIAALLLQRPADKTQQAEQRIEGFSKDFKKLDELNSQALHDAVEELSESDGSAWARDQKPLWEKQFTAVLVYENGQLSAWNTSDVPVRFHLDDRSKIMNGAIRLKNGLYLARTETLDDDRSVVCLTLIRNEYPNPK